MKHKHFPTPMFCLLTLVLALCTTFTWRATSTDTPSAQPINSSSLDPESATERSPVPNSQQPTPTTAATDPVLYFSDITSGSKSGNTDTPGGRYDEATPAITETVHRAIPGSEWVIFENSSRIPHVEETERFLQVFDNFLNRVEAQA